MARNVETNSPKLPKSGLKVRRGSPFRLVIQTIGAHNQRQDDLYLQSLHFVVGLWSGFSGSQWMCCAPFGASVQHSGQNLFTFQVIYHPPHDRLNTMAPWINKLITEYHAGNVAVAIMLVDAATETRWFSVLYEFPMCFVEGRISFQNGEGKLAGSPIGGSVFVYLGDQHDKFVTVFRRFGKVLFLSSGMI